MTFNPKLDDLVFRLGGRNLVAAMLENRALIVPMENSSSIQEKWSQDDDIIRFSVISDGMDRCNNHFIGISKEARYMLCNNSFKSTRNVITEIALIKAVVPNQYSQTFLGEPYLLDNIVAEGTKRGFRKPDLEVCCLIIEKFTPLELNVMGIDELVMMHEPIDGGSGVKDFIYMSAKGCIPHISTWLRDSFGGFKRGFTIGCAFVLS